MSRILVVEDNPRNLKLVREVLIWSGHDVVEATSGEDGVQLAADDAPDLILLDLQLPGIDGVEALRRLRAGDRTRWVPVVAVTAFAMDEDRERVAEAGFDGYLTKPISVRGLTRTVDGLLGRDGEP